jgi:F-type H+-transporting ATPase subunit b
MQIRIDILITQMIGFLIVFWVLKRYAWGPVLGMLEERRQRIAREVAEAESRRREAEALKVEYENQLKSIETQARQKIQEAMQEGQKAAEEIRAGAQREARGITEKARQNLELEYKKARVELRGEIVDLALGAAERLLEEKLDPREHSRVVERFLSRLEAEEAR